ncbi:MAG TPA: hypothetical protein VFY17_00070, partial [Pilimelia sp.]|nr:hypothetical protein [Pilimelia sp.]
MAIPRGRGAFAAAGAAAALCAWTAPAAALDVRREITFLGGGLLGLRCAATPDIDAVTVTAETKLHVRNATGYSATLLTNDEPIGEVAADAVAELLLHRGPVELTLKPHCVTTRYGSVRVQVVGPPVTPPPARTAAPGPPPATPAPTASPTAPAATATPAARATAAAPRESVDPLAGHAGLGRGGPGGPV